MRKDILIVDTALLIIFAVIIVLKIIGVNYRFIQPLFFVLMIVHIVQHWKIIKFNILKQIRKKK